jgi:hypothetical protein
LSQKLKTIAHKGAVGDKKQRTAKPMTKKDFIYIFFTIVEVITRSYLDFSKFLIAISLG